MTEGDRLLSAVLAEPADDAPRLVYADWLEEQGRGLRAEFIRVQVAEARLGLKDCPHKRRQDESFMTVIELPCGVCEWCALRRRAEDIHGMRHVLGLERCPAMSKVGEIREGPPSPGPPVLVWRRGFVEEIHGALWLSRRPSMIQVLRRVCPSHPVTLVRVTGRKPGLDSTLRFYSWVNGGPIRRLRNPLLIEGRRRPRWQTTAVSTLLPTPVWVRLPDPVKTWRVATKSYPSEQAALDALSAACIAFGRVPRQISPTRRACAPAPTGA